MKKEMKEEMQTFSEVKVWNHSGSTYGRDAGATEAQLETELETARFEEVGPFHLLPWIISSYERLRGPSQKQPSLRDRATIYTPQPLRSAPDHGANTGNAVECSLGCIMSAHRAGDAPPILVSAQSRPGREPRHLRETSAEPDFAGRDLAQHPRFQQRWLRTRRSDMSFLL